jgi:putative ABC transport system substrate-binding protein
MKRREFITLLSSVAAAWPLAARAQQLMPVIGFLNVGSPAAYAQHADSFRHGLSEGGYVEGRNISIEYRWAEGRHDRLPILANELAQRHVALIVAAASTVVLAAKQANPTIPIVFVLGDDPVRIGLAASYNRPGGNATGFTMFTLAIVAKRMELMHELVPGTSPLAVLVNTNSAMAHIEAAKAQATGHALGREVRSVNVTGEADFAAAYAATADMQAGGLLVTSDPFLTNRREQLVALAARHKLPANYPFRSFADAGGLVSYGASLRDAYRQIGRYVARILNGEKPGDLPIQQPTKFELVINLKTAKALGLTVPPTLFARADEVIE